MSIVGELEITGRSPMATMKVDVDQAALSLLPLWFAEFTFIA
jgi:hypothetical protein